MGHGPHGWPVLLINPFLRMVRRHRVVAETSTPGSALCWTASSIGHLRCPRLGVQPAGPWLRHDSAHCRYGTTFSHSLDPFRPFELRSPIAIADPSQSLRHAIPERRRWGNLYG
jgi:hypothetical protein